MNSPRVVWLVVGAILTAVAGGGAGWMLNQASRRGASPDQGPRSPATEDRGVVCFGYVDLEHGVTALSALQPGRVMEVLVHENQAVSAGAPLLRLDDRGARLGLAKAQALLEAAQLQLVQADKNVQQHQAKVAQQQAVLEAVSQRREGAQNLLLRKRELLTAEQTNPREVAAANNLVKELEAQEKAETARLTELRLHDPELAIRSARAETAANRARLDEAQQAVDDCTLKAPSAGVVLRVLVGPGDLLSGLPKPPALMFCPDGPRLIRAEVEQEFAGLVKEGQKALVEDAIISGTIWRGQVLRVSAWYTKRRSIMQEPLQTNDVRTVECLINLNPDQPPLRIGQRVRVRIERGSEP